MLVCRMISLVMFDSVAVNVFKGVVHQCCFHELLFSFNGESPCGVASEIENLIQVRVDI